MVRVYLHLGMKINHEIKVVLLRFSFFSRTNYCETWETIFGISETFHKHDFSLGRGCAESAPAGDSCQTMSSVSAPGTLRIWNLVLPVVDTFIIAKSWVDCLYNSSRTTGNPPLNIEMYLLNYKLWPSLSIVSIQNNDIYFCEAVQLKKPL